MPADYSLVLGLPVVYAVPRGIVLSDYIIKEASCSGNAAPQAANRKALLSAMLSIV
jgi:hypothetical protein